MTKYWIGTNEAYYFLTNVNLPDDFKLLFMLKECSRLEYFLFSSIAFNNKAKDKFFWMKKHIRKLFNGNQT